jgi:uncharacterized phage-like protein YoqJ
MEGKACCFIGHRKIERTDKLIKNLTSLIGGLIHEQGVNTFLFGSRSEFDDLCHEIVTELQKKNPQIKRIMYTCRSEYAVKKEEKEERERIARAVTKRDIKYKDYDGAMMSDRLWSAGKASYVERNQDMIDASDYCVFYYNERYKPPRRKYSKCSVGDYQPKSGTKLAFEYASQKKQEEKYTTIINVYKSET